MGVVATLRAALQLGCDALIIVSEGPPGQPVLWGNQMTSRFSAARLRARSLIVIVGFIVTTLALAGCGKSERQKREEQAAEDARWEANVAAAEAERQKREEQLVKKELSRFSDSDATSGKPANEHPGFVSIADGAAARAAKEKENRERAESAAEYSNWLSTIMHIKDQEIEKMKSDLPGHAGATAGLRTTHFNTAHTAICGQIDFNYSPNGAGSLRSGPRNFIIGSTTRQTIPVGRPGNSGQFLVGIDLNFRDYGENYARLAAVNDCTPDTNR